MKHDENSFQGYMDFYSGMSSRIRQLAEDIKKIKLPVIIMEGDGGADAARSQIFYDFIGSEDKILKRYAQLRH